MAEQISHIKTLKKLDNDKRKLLKEYYRLDKSGIEDKFQDRIKEEVDNEVHNNNVAGATVMSRRNVSDVEELDAEAQVDVARKTLSELLRVQNILLTRETEADNNIKNTIYDNYYDLIKVDKTLLEVSRLDEDLLSKLKETCSMASKI